MTHSDELLYAKTRLARIRWEFESAANRSTLGFLGFAFQAVVSVVVVWYAGAREIFIAFPLLVMAVAALTLFWVLWAREARRVRAMMTELLNLYVDADDFTVPHVSPVNSRYAPEAALVLVAEALGFIAILIWH